MSCASGLLTTTCGSAAGRVSAELRLSPGEYLSQALTSAIPTRPAAIHSLADARPLLRRPLPSCRSSDVSCLSVTIPLVPPDVLFLLSAQLKSKKSPRLFPYLPNQTGQRYSCERSLEAVLGLGKNPRHALLEVAADRTPLVCRVRMNRKRPWCPTRTVYIQQRDLSRRTRKHARPALAAFCHHQARFRELGERLSNEGRVGVHTVGQGCRGDFFALEVPQGSHYVGGNRKLDALN